VDAGAPAAPRESARSPSHVAAGGASSLVPPSIDLIVIGVVANISIGGLFAAGLLPSLINLTALVMLVSVVAGELLTPLLIPLFSGNKPAEAIALAVQVTRALFPQVFFMMLAALCIGILNAYKKFASTSFGPSIYNIFVVLSIVLFGMIGKDSPYDAVRVASGVMVAACIYFLIQFYLARREFRNYVFSFDYRDRGFRRLLNLAIPTLISGSIVQLNAIILTGFANWFEPGIVSSLRQASTTWQLPYGIFAENGGDAEDVPHSVAVIAFIRNLGHIVGRQP